MSLVVIGFLWISWCAMHSFLIDASVLRFLKKHVPVWTRYYRLMYNAVALATLVPLLVITRLAEGPVVVSWGGYLVSLRVFLLITAFLLFRGGAQKYDLQYFLGIKQLLTGKEHLLLSDKEEFTESGVFGITRHPWYFGSLLFLWSMLAEYSLPVFLAVCIMSFYLIIGTMLEERKIVAQYGDAYRRYRQRVSMLFPWKWLKRSLQRCTTM